MNFTDIMKNLENVVNTFHMAEIIGFMTGKEVSSDSKTTELFKGLKGVLGDADQLTVRAIVLGLPKDDQKYWTSFMMDFILKHDGTLTQQADAWLVINAVETFITKLHQPGSPTEVGNRRSVMKRKAPAHGSREFIHTINRKIMTTPGKSKAESLMMTAIKILKEENILNDDDSILEDNCRKAMKELNFYIPPLRKVGEGGILKWAADSQEWISQKIPDLQKQLPKFEKEMKRRANKTRRKPRGLFYRITHFGGI